MLTNNAAGVSLAGTFSGSGAGLTNIAWNNSRSGLLATAAAGAYTAVRTRYNANGTPTNATILWPDGTYGVWMATNINPTWLTADGYTLTYTNRGETIAQPTMLRDENGNVTNAPVLVIAP